MESTGKQTVLSTTSWKRRFLAMVGYITYLNIFFFHPDGPVRFVLQACGFFAFAAIIFLQRKSIKEHLSVVVSLGMLLAIASGVLVTRGFGFVQFLSVMTSMTTLLATVYLLSAELPFFRSTAEYLLMPLRLLKTYIKSWFTSTVGGVIAAKQNKTTSLINPKTIFFIFFVTVPLLVFLIGLLASGDPIYGKFIEGILTRNLIARVFFSLVLFFFLIPFLTFAQKKEFRSPLVYLGKFSLTREMTITMGLVALVLGSFLLIQWPYIFAKVAFETDLSKFGVATYSEYVRKGFGELLVVSGLVYSLVWVGLVSLRGKLYSRALLLLQILVMSELGIFIFSLFRRIWLYQEYHGWSLIRLYGGFFLLWLGGITLTLLLRHVSRKNWFLVESIFSALLFLFVGIFNAEEFIVKNHPPTVNKQVDYVYLSRMSSDGYIGLLQAYNHAKTTLQDKSYQQKSLLDMQDRQKIAYAGMVAFNLLETHDNLIKKHGTTEELREYYVSLASLYHKNEVKRLTAEEQQMMRNQSQYYDLTSQRTRVTELEKAIEDIKKERVSLTNVERAIQLYRPSFYFADAYGENIVVTVRLDLFDINRDTQKVWVTEFDRFLTWNKSEKIGYERMKNEISYKELLQMLETYLVLREKIMVQPDNERDYQRDISTESPLLD